MEKFIIIEIEEGEFQVIDTTEGRLVCVCFCYYRKDMDMIAKALNYVWKQVQDEETVSEMGG